MCLVMVRTGRGTVIVHCGWKTTVVCEEGKIFVDGAVPVCGELIN